MLKAIQPWHSQRASRYGPNVKQENCAMLMRLMAKPFTTTVLLASLTLLTACSHTEVSKATNAPSKETIQAGQRLYDERCKTVAGNKIYRTVPDVDGIVLLKVRHEPPPGALDDRDWPGAAFAQERRNNGYIEMFLAYEYAFKRSDGIPTRISPPKERGAILTELRTDVIETHPGYRFVDVQDEQTGQWWRYSGSVREVPFEYSKFNGGDGKIHMIKRFVLDKVAAPTTRPRCGVTFVDHVIPEERAFGLASSTSRS
jgi:hypothetical protein